MVLIVTKERKGLFPCALSIKTSLRDAVGEVSYHVFHLPVSVTFPVRYQTTLTRACYICLTSQFCSPIISAISTCSWLQ